MNSTDKTTSMRTVTAIEGECGNEHPIRYYLHMMRKRILCENCVPIEDTESKSTIPLFVPQCLVTAVKLPTGAIEIAVNHSGIIDKIDYILSAYDSNMRLSHSPADGPIEMVEVFIV